MAAIKLNLNPEPKTLRQFGLIGLVAFALFAVLAYYRVVAFAALPVSAVRPTVWVLALLAGYCGVFAAIAPKGLRPLYVLLTVVFYPVGLVASYVIMGIVYFIVLTPVALIFKLIGRDPMCRKFEPAAQTYWVERKPPTDMKRYFRQF